MINHDPFYDNSVIMKYQSYISKWILWQVFLPCLIMLFVYGMSLFINQYLNNNFLYDYRAYFSSGELIIYSMLLMLNLSMVIDEFHHDHCKILSNCCLNHQLANKKITISDLSDIMKLLSFLLMIYFGWSKCHLMISSVHDIKEYRNLLSLYADINIYILINVLTLCLSSYYYAVKDILNYIYEGLL